MKTMQGKTLSRRSAAGMPWALTLIMAYAVLSVGSCAPDESEETGETAKSALDEVPEGVTVLQAGVNRRHMCYCAYLLVDPMTEAELRHVGSLLIEEAKPLTLKGFIYYNQASYDLGGRIGSESLGMAVFLNAVSSDYDLRIDGPVPKARTTEACWRAWMESQSYCKMLAWEDYQTSADKEDSAWSKYDASQGVLEFQEMSLAVFENTPVCMPAIVSTMIREHLSCSRGRMYWHCIPDLKKVTIHFVDSDKVPVITFTYDRGLYERAVLLPDKQWKQRVFVEIPDMVFKAEDEFRAMVITEEEFKTRKRLASDLLWQLYKEVWVAVAGQISIQKHRKILVEAPRDYYLW